MPPLPIVEELEVLEEFGVRLRPSGPDCVVDQLDFQRREEALGNRVVPAIAPAAHAADDPVLRQHPLVVAWRKRCGLGVPNLENPYHCDPNATTTLCFDAGAILIVGLARVPEPAIAASPWGWPDRTGGFGVAALLEKQVSLFISSLEKGILDARIPFSFSLGLGPPVRQ
jgi:hypothetical protein